jgi:hypothetical protein
MQQSPDKGTLSIVHAAAGQQAQKFLAFVLRKVGRYVGADKIGLM